MSQVLQLRGELGTVEIFHFANGVSVVETLIVWRSGDGMLSVSYEGGNHTEPYAIGGRRRFDCPNPFEAQRVDGGFTFLGDDDWTKGVFMRERHPFDPRKIIDGMVSAETECISDFIGCVIGDGMVGSLEASFPGMSQWNRLGIAQGIGAAFVHRYVRAVAEHADDGPRAWADAVLEVWKSLVFESLASTVDAILFSQEPRHDVLF